MNTNVNQKDAAVRRVVTALAERYGCESYAIVDHWDADMLAIGLARLDDHSVLAYIAAHDDSSYYIELELGPEPGSDQPYSVAGTFNSLAIDDALDTVAAHLGL